MDPLVRIKRLVVARRVQFTYKAEVERVRDALSVDDILESIVNANAIKKTLRSRADGHAGDVLYVIESPSFLGTWIYTKGTIRGKKGEEVFYVFVSAKIAT